MNCDTFLVQQKYYFPIFKGVWNLTVALSEELLESLRLSLQDDRISLHSLLKKKDELIYKSRVPEQLRKDDSSQNGTRTRSKAVRADNSRGGKMDRQLLYMNKPLQILLGRKSRFNTDVLRTFTIAVLSFINVVKRIVIYVIKKKKRQLPISAEHNDLKCFPYCPPQRDYWRLAWCSWWMIE